MRAVLIRALKYSPWNPCLKITPPYSSIRQGCCALVAGCDDGEIVVREVLAARGQLVVHELGQHLLQLHEEPFARRIAVRVHFVAD